MGKQGFRRSWVIYVLLVVPGLIHAQQLPPFTYYLPATNLTSTALKSALHEIVKGHTVIPYSSSGFDTHDALAVLDRDPSNSANVLLIYSGSSVAASTWPDWNREHIWPQSFGVDSGNANSDLLNLRACDQGVNSSRGNKYYDVSTGSIGYHAGAPESSYDGDSWEPRDADKGYVARAAFYVSTRYNGSGGDPNLQLAESPNAAGRIFARLSTLLDWNRRFPPTDSERIRNGAIFQTYQHNRNPFIDNPDFADMVFLGVDGYAAWQGTHFSAAELSNATVVAAAADPDGDGLPNIAEYTFAHDPHTADGNVIQSLSQQLVSGTNYLYLTHHRHHYLSGIGLTYQVSTNLIAWDDVVPEVITNVQMDVMKDLTTVRLPATGQSRFVRFRITRLADQPVIVADGSTLLAEDCTPSNGLLDPGETVTISFSLKNVGSAATSNLVVTLLGTGGVISPSSPQNYGVIHADGGSATRSFTFTTAGDCGGNIIATLQLQDGSANLGTVVYTFSLGQFVNPLNEDFDIVTAPALPGGWTTAASGAQSNWVTSSTQADTAPNAAFSPDPLSIGVNELVSPSFSISSASARLMFAHNYSLIASTTNSSVGYDGGVLEIKIGGGAFQDILAAGGSFALGGYNATLSSDYGNPLAGRQAWSGNSLDFVTTIVNLPAAAAGQNVQFRWRCGTGNAPIAPADITPLSSGPLAGWDVSAQSGYGTSPLAPSTTAANVTVGGLTRGSGVGTGGTAAGRAWGGTGWVDGSAAAAITNNRLATFTVQANPGFKVSLSGISKFDYRRSTTGPPNGLLQYRVGAADSFHDVATLSYSSSSSSGASIGAIDLSTISALQNVAPGTVITFRIVNWGGGSVGTWYIFDKDNNADSDFEIQGTVTPVPVNDGWYIDSAFIEDAVCCVP